MSSSGNFSAVGVPGAFLVNALGLEGVSGSGAGIYAVKTGASVQTTKLASFPAEGQSTGFSALTSQEVAVFGYGVFTDAFRNHLLAVAPATYKAALSGGTTLALSSSNSVDFYAGEDVLGASSLGSGAVINRGRYSSDFTTLTRLGLSRVELTISGSGAPGVTAGALEPVLTNSDQCTRVGLLAPLGADLLVGVSDKNGSRLVRLSHNVP